MTIKTIKLFIILLAINSLVYAQGSSKKVLFLGNSYTASNNLPQMIANLALSTADTLIYDSNTPGGYTFNGHSTNSVSLSKIASNDWDFVVLQEQSQLPSFPISQVSTQVFPFARSLDSLINLNNSCTETVFFMTWGRKNGDSQNCATWPPVCTYNGMDSLLNLRYRMMAVDNNAILSPVGAVWNYIRQNYPSIELYLSDESHPSLAGTYAAACCFYAVLFRKDPSLITFNPGLSATESANIRAAVKTVVYDNFSDWHIGEYDPSADFNFNVIGNGNVEFFNSSLNASNYLWNFGDGTFSNLQNPTHNYLAVGQYEVSLIADNCGMTDTVKQSVNILSIDIEEEKGNSFKVYPNPSSGDVCLFASQDYLGANYIVYDFYGKAILLGKISSELTILNLNNMSSGFYYLKIGDSAKDKVVIIKK